ncbi:hypothetical protein [Chengkuizengella axinellae]|uniref:Uncharacterized protein n=1 Tax=Chengkuizengella axinellae TaxID=3064388 RepID=A0ABT9IYD5_9BACL|nr:hypothetical protein [Chengkuizengella sp. 2205SS18-9]MDP5274369.1 hypothetical protein [Chengkuizengella sp. 2205SS18-9]
MRKVKSMSFNLADPYEKELNEHAKKFTNFSGYVKRLIQRDMEGNAIHFHQPKQQEVTTYEENNDKSILMGFL